MLTHELRVHVDVALAAGVPEVDPLAKPITPPNLIFREYGSGGLQLIQATLELSVEALSERSNFAVALLVSLLQIDTGRNAPPPRGGGSHYKVSKPGKLEILTIPFKRPIKPVYIRKLVAFLRDSEHG